MMLTLNCSRYNLAPFHSNPRSGIFSDGTNTRNKKYNKTWINPIEWNISVFYCPYFNNTWKYILICSIKPAINTIMVNMCIFIN